MAKKKKIMNKELKGILSIAGIILGLVAVIMMFLPAIAIKDSDTTYTGLQVAFGAKETTTILGNTITAVIFEFSIMNLLTYAFLLGGVVFSVLSFINRGGKFASFIAMALTLVAGIFFFLTISFSLPGEGLKDLASLFGGNIKDSFILGAGSIIGAITSLLSCACLAVRTFVK